MDNIKKSDKLNSIIKDYKLIEENIFIGRITDIALEDKDLVISKIQVLLKDPKTGIHLKYLMIKTIGSLKFHNFIPLLSRLLNTEENIRIISEVLNSLTNIISLESYKVVTAFFSDPKNKMLLPKFNGYLKLFFGKSPLIYHFDLFYRDRGEVKNIEVSSNFLIDNLEKSYVKDLLPAIFSKYKTISFESLRLFEKKPGSLFYNSINELFLKNYKDEPLYFKQIVKTLFMNAAVSPHKKKIFLQLKNHLKVLSKERRNYFIIYMLKLDTKEIIKEAHQIYNDLNIDDKLSFFSNLDPQSYPLYKVFIKKRLIDETNDNILLRILSILMLNDEYDYIFNTISDQVGAKKEKLLNLIVETKKKGLSDYFAKFISITIGDSILLTSIGYIMTDKPDAHFENIQKTLFAGIDISIKQRIIRNIRNFNKSNIKKILRRILKNKFVIDSIEKDFLLMLISLQDKNLITDNLLDPLLNMILQLMEETDPDDLINFIYFFDSFKVNKNENKALIVDELKMIQTTLIKSSKNDNLVNLIYKLVKKIEV